VIRSDNGVLCLSACPVGSGTGAVQLVNDAVKVRRTEAIADVVGYSGAKPTFQAAHGYGVHQPS